MAADAAVAEAATAGSWNIRGCKGGSTDAGAAQAAIAAAPREFVFVQRGVKKRREVETAAIAAVWGRAAIAAPPAEAFATALTTAAAAATEPLAAVRSAFPPVTATQQKQQQLLLCQQQMQQQMQRREAQEGHSRSSI